MNHEDYANATRKFKPGELGLYTTAHWRVLLRAKQITLGSLILLPNDPIDDYSSITPEIASDLFAVVATSQSILRTAFAPDRFNLIAAGMKDPFVHFHLIPRYQTARTFASLEWNDKDWPELIAFRNVETDPAVHEILVAQLSHAFNQATQ